MKKANLYLKATQIRRLKALARETGAPVAVLIRRAIDQFLDRREAEKGKVKANGGEKTN
jgi:predicted transcriptional regulator